MLEPLFLSIQGCYSCLRMHYATGSADYFCCLPSVKSDRRRTRHPKRRMRERERERERRKRREAAVLSFFGEEEKRRQREGREGGGEINVGGGGTRNDVSPSDSGSAGRAVSRGKAAKGSPVQRRQEGLFLLVSSSCEEHIGMRAIGAV